MGPLLRTETLWPEIAAVCCFLLLPWIGSTGRVGFGAACMVAYSFGLGLLFWVVGTFAVGLPKSGRWMEWVKSAFGLVMVGSALFFLRACQPGHGSMLP